ncbi:hypothetical protein [Halostella litorea]|uniref:hypothetical protein n=1 Tax=Halostella litorea TaxID=2528831 RepID=UPI00192A222C|nr:hypothetical protein [Halostella litorea]
MTSTDPSRLPAPVSGALGVLPWRSLLVDLVLVVAWVVVVSVAFRVAGWPLLAYYAVVFGGVLGYSLRGRALASRLRG